MRMLQRFAALLTVFALLAVPAALCEETGMDEVAILEEEMNQIGSEEEGLYVARLELADVPEAGSYAWYAEPAIPLELHAFIDVYPEESPLYAQADAEAVGGMGWTFAFTLEEIGGYDFYPSVLTVSYFAQDESGEYTLVARELHDSDELLAWWGSNCIAANAAVTYVGKLAVQDMSAVAVSIIGIDDKGLEMEFHGLVTLTPETRE